MLQEMMNTIDQKRVERFTPYQSNFLANVRSRIEGMRESGDQEALLLLMASITEILDAAVGETSCQPVKVDY